MKTTEIVNLISIRDYVARSINNFSLKKENINDLNKILILLDNKLVKELTSDSFKKEVNFESAEEAIKEIANMRLR